MFILINWLIGRFISLGSMLSDTIFDVRCTFVYNVDIHVCDVYIDAQQIALLPTVRLHYCLTYVPTAVFVSPCCSDLFQINMTQLLYYTAATGAGHASAASTHVTVTVHCTRGSACGSPLSNLPTWSPRKH